MQNDVFHDEKISRAYMKLALPVVFSLVITLIYNLADTFFVAQTNNTGLVAGVSLGAPVFTLLMGLGNMFAQGGTSLISRLLGSGEDQKVRSISSFCFWAAVAIGVVATAVMLLFPVPILHLLGANEESLPHAMEYFIVLGIGAPGIVVSFIHSNLLRAEGMSKESMFGTTGGAIANIILDPIMISGMHMGALGAAVATVTGYVLSDIYFLFIVAKKSKKLSVDPRLIKVSGPDLGQIFGIGIPAAFSNLMTSVSMAMVNQFLLPYGNDKIAAMGIVLKVVMIAQLILTGFAFGGQPLFGFHYGAGDEKRFAELLRFCFVFIGGLALALTVVIFAAAPLLMGCFMDNAQIISEGTVMLRWQVISSVCVGLVLLMNIVFQSTGKIVPAFIMSISRQGVVFIAVLLVANMLAGYNGIIATQAIADAVSAVLALALFARSGIKINPQNG